jgi:hypothetical protein
MIGQVFSTFVRSFARAPLAWLLLIAVAAGTEVALFAIVPEGGRNSAAAVGAILAVRALGAMYLTAAMIRRLAGTPAPWRLDFGFAWFVLWEIAILALVEAGAVGVVRGGGTVMQPVFHRAFAAFAAGIVTPLADLLSLRLAAWAVVKTAAVGDTTLRASWRATRGQWGGAAAAYLVLVLPLFALHLAATAWPKTEAPAPALQHEAAIGDGLLSAVLAGMLVALYVTIWRRRR